MKLEMANVTVSAKGKFRPILTGQGEMGSI